MKTLGKTELLTWLGRALKPLLRIALERGLKLNDVMEVIKMSLVALAHDELKKKAAPVSDSKVSAMTGVHRRDAKRLQPARAQAKQAKDLISRVMAQWQLDKDFLDEQGKTKSLSCSGRESDFAKLVLKVNGADISPYAVLYEMERMGIVARTQDEVSLVWKDFVIEQDVHQALDILRQDLSDLVHTVTQNVSSSPGNARDLHLRTEFDNIPLSEIPRLRRWILEEGSRFHARVREIIGQADRDISHTSCQPQEGRGRLAFCSFAAHEIVNANNDMQ